VTSWARSATACAAALASGELTSRRLVLDLLDRAAQVDHRIGGYTVIDADGALGAADEADAARARGDVKGALHGLPVTVKDSVDVVGLPSTLGLLSRSGHRAEGDAAIVAALRQAGAIFLGKSNVPQALLSGAECENPLWGATLNPWSAGHGPGGSSGGEAALLASGSSMLGIGTDLGGSIRSPAAYCGIVGFKPTPDRLANRGLNPTLPGQELVRGQVGPMARTVADCRLLFDGLVAVEQHHHDPRVPPMRNTGCRGSVAGARIGVYDDDGFVSASPACRRAVRLAVEALVEQGAEIVPFAPVDQEEVVAVTIAGLAADRMATLRDLLADEEIAGPAKLVWRTGFVPPTVRRLVARLLPMFGEDRFGRLVAATLPTDVQGYWRLVARRDELRYRELDRWQREGIDAVICPVTATPPIPVGESADFTQAFGYTGRYNLVGLPAGTVPVTTVTSDECRPWRGGDRMERRAASIERQSGGLPVGVQVVGLPWQDGWVLKVMAEIEAFVSRLPGWPIVPVPATNA
jgi:fatty acid amide hydrolase